MEEDKEIDMLQQDIQQLINRCMILNKDEMTATARVMLGIDIVLRFRKILQENKQQADIIKNSVSKDKIKEELEIAKTKYNTYKEGVKTNNSLKNGMFKHLGEKNMCEKLLGIQKNITTLD